MRQRFGLESEFKDNHRTVAAKGDAKDDWDLIDIRELSRMTALSIYTFYEMISENRLPFPRYKLGRCVRFRRADIIRWIESKGNLPARSHSGT